MKKSKKGESCSSECGCPGGSKGHGMIILVLGVLLALGPAGYGVGWLSWFKFSGWSLALMLCGIALLHKGCCK